MSIRFIVNPSSGSLRKNPHIVDQIKSFVSRTEHSGSIVFSEHPNHAIELSRQAVEDQCTIIVAVGGDGTMNEVAQQLVATNSALGLIPCGSGNGLGRHLGIPLNPIDALETIKSGRILEIDTGSANGHLFFNVMGVGFDVEISHRFNSLRKRGFLSYLRVCTSVYLRSRSEHYTVFCGEERSEHQAWLITVANSSQYGNNAIIAPGARINDGLLDLTRVNKPHPFAAIPLAVRLFNGTIDKSPSVLSLRGARFIIERERPGLFHTDGQTHESDTRLVVEVKPHSLRILTPTQ